jgi:sugar lactone lactonase YvrE
MIKVPYSTRFGVVFSMIGVGVILAACSGGQILPPPLSNGGGGGTGGGTTTGDMTTTSASGTGGGTSGTGGTGGAAPAVATWVAKLDATKFQLPEGLAMNAAGDTAYVGLAPTGQILQIKVADGAVSDFGSVPQPPANKGFVLGVQTDKAGDFYVAVASFDAMYQPGIYKIPAAGGAGVLFAKDAAMTFPNGLTFNAAGDLFVTDSVSGSIFKITSAGVVTKWLTDPLITGDTMSKCPSGLPFPLGANGIVQSGTDFYVTNTDKASMAKIAIKADGTAGAVTDFVATDCMNFGGPDGLSVDSDGKFLVASNGINSITRVGTDGKVSLVIAKTVPAPLDSPASTWIVNAGKAGSTLFFTNSGIASFQAGGMPKPGLFKLPL